MNKFETIAKVRISYCSARANIERARILSKQGKNLEAGEIFAEAASQFRDICVSYNIDREKMNLEAIYFLCLAWENMEFGEKYEDPNRFARASELFSKSSNLFTDSKLKLLSSGNSYFCMALESSYKFDETNETQIKMALYPQIKSKLRNAANSYQKGGFENGANWALATSTYFDAIWNLIKVDEELNLEKKNELLDRCIIILKSAAELFGKAGYQQKEKEVLKHLEMIEKEEKIILSALNTIEKPSISSSTVGLVAPSCPIENSQAPSISESHQLADETRKVKEKGKSIKEEVGEKEIEKDLSEKRILTRPKSIPKPIKSNLKSKIADKSSFISKTSEFLKRDLEKIESEVEIEEKDYICIVHRGPIEGTTYICPKCKTFYCIKCVKTLKESDERCWYCDYEFTI
jgi:hypothetical protein